MVLRAHRRNSRGGSRVAPGVLIAKNFERDGPAHSKLAKDAAFRAIERRWGACAALPLKRPREKEGPKGDAVEEGSNFYC